MTCTHEVSSSQLQSASRGLLSQCIPTQYYPSPPSPPFSWLYPAQEVRVLVGTVRRIPATSFRDFFIFSAPYWRHHYLIPSHCSPHLICSPRYSTDSPLCLEVRPFIHAIRATNPKCKSTVKRALEPMFHTVPLLICVRA
jgi:hypothetical protein